MSPPASPRRGPPGNCQDREKVKLAQLLSRAVAEEMAGLEAVWNVAPDSIDFDALAAGLVDDETTGRAAMIAMLRRIGDYAVTKFAGQTFTPPQAEQHAAAAA